jgi:undecaprenyl-diphosphatase
VGQGTFHPRTDISGYGATFMRRTSILTMSCVIFLLVYAVESGATSEIDRAVLLYLRQPGDLAVPIGPPWLLDVARDVTSFGSTSVTLSVMGVATLAALFYRRLRLALFVLAAVGAGSAFVNLVKLAIRRVRPDVVPHLTSEVTFSFPSSHAAVSVMTYGALALLVVRAAPQLRRFAYGAAGLCVIAIGATRLYLGVHYPTDVLAGWLFGMTWLLVCRSAFGQHWMEHGEPRS